MHADLDDAVVLARRGNHNFAFGGGVGGGLLDIDVLAGGARQHGGGGVPVVGGGAHQAVDGGVVERLAEIFDSLGRAASLGADGVDALFDGALIDVAHVGELHAVDGGELGGEL